MFEIWADGVLFGTYSITSSGTSISETINFSGSLPSSLEFRFNDASPETGRSINIRNVSINGRSVNTDNYLSSDTLTNGGSSTVDIPSADYIFDPTAAPAASEFTTGATMTMTGVKDIVREYDVGTDQVVDLLGGNDIAYLGWGDDKISGGDGADTLYGSGGIDTFLFEATSAYNDIDEIENFVTGSGGDILDLSDLLSGASGSITDKINFVDSGGDTLVQVDANGSTGGANFVTVGQINGLTGLDEATLFADGNILA